MTGPLSSEPAGGPAGPTASTASGRRIPRWMWIALVASLCVNFLVVGLFAGSVWRLRRAEAMAAGGIAAPVRQLMARMPAERRGDVAVLVEERREKARGLRREMRKAREAAVAALSAEPYDRANSERAITQLLEADQRVREAFLLSLPAIAEKLTPDERRWLAQGRWAGGWRRHHGNSEE